MVSVSSLPLGESLFAPHVLLLDGKGGVRRELTGDSFVFRGQAQQATARLQASDRFVVVRSDAQRVGSKISRVTGSVRNTLISTGFAFVPVNTGSESEQTLTLSHSGTITVTSELMPAAP